MLCGERRIEWDRGALVAHLKLVSNEQAPPPAPASRVMKVIPFMLFASNEQAPPPPLPRA